jgi:hypothetical protein
MKGFSFVKIGVDAHVIEIECSDETKSFKILSLHPCVLEYYTNAMFVDMKCRFVGTNAGIEIFLAVIEGP